MIFYADEGVDKHIVDRLRADGNTVVYVAELDPGIDDEAVLRDALQRDSILITEDKDFGELVYRQELGHSGILLLRLGTLEAIARMDLVSRVVSELNDHLASAFCVISPGRVRIRKRFEPKEAQDG